MILAGLIAAAAAQQGAPAVTTTPPAAAAPAPSAAARTGAGAEGVIVYRPDYFADARPNTAFDMIRRLPGFNFSGGDQVRGFGGAAGNVLIDGQRPASKSDALADILNRIPASDVERIEVISGGAGGVDMQGYTVIANVVRRTGARAQGLLAAAVTAFPDDEAAYAFRAEGSRRWNGRQLELSLLAYTSIFNGDGADGYRRRVGPDGALQFDSRVIGYGYGEGLDLKGGFNTPLTGGTLRLNASLSLERPETSETTIFLPSAGVDLVTFEQPNVEGEAGLNYKRPLGPRTEVEGILLQRRSSSELQSGSKGRTGTVSLFTEDATAGESIARGIFRFRRSERLTFETGAEGAFNFLDSQTAFTQNGVPVPLPASQVRVKERRAEAFGTVTWRRSPKLTVEAGSRFEVSTLSQSGSTDLEKSFFYPKPRAVLTWSPNPENQLRLRVERRVGQLNFGDFVSSATFSTDDVEAGNADLEPSKSTTYEAAYERRFWKSGALVLTLGHSNITDALDRIPVRGPTGLFDAVGNIGDGETDYLRIDLTLPTDKLGIPRGQLKTFGSWVDSDVIDPTTGEERRTSGNSPFIGEVHFTQDLPRFKSTWGFDYTSPFESTSFRFNEIRLNDFDAYLSAFVEMKPRPEWSIRVEAQNLLSRSLRRERIFYAGTRNENLVLFQEVRDVDFPPFLYLRVRRTYGQ